MPIFIAKTYEGFVESIVLAKSQQLANVYWQGQNIYPHSVTEKTEEDLRDHPTGVLPIVRTKKIRLSAFGRNEKYYLVIDK